MAVLGTAVPGIRELVRPGETGWLCGVSADQMREGLIDLMADAGERARRGAAAREYAVGHFSLARVLELEMALLSEVVG
jgi:glycosyltransferase involved in cell wall biosynthesis